MFYFFFFFFFFFFSFFFSHNREGEPLSAFLDSGTAWKPKWVVRSALAGTS